MTIEQPPQPSPQKPLRLWPGVVAAVLICVAKFGLPTVLPEALPFGVLGGVLGGLFILVWWAFFSRAPGVERWGAIVLMIVAALATSRVIDKSIATGMMGMMFPVVAIPILSLALVVWAAASRGLSDGPRRATMVATVLLACGVWTLLRTGGISGEGVSDFAWRWTPTAEERLLAQASDKPAAIPSAPVAAKIAAEPLVARTGGESTPHEPVPSAAKMAKLEAKPEAKLDPKPEARPGPDWPGFRGPHRDSIVPGVRIETNWSASPPVELWRRPIGPGWSSFAVRGEFIYTQEQRGDDEVVACYNLNTGKPAWTHRDAARFWESNAGAGPRGTPTVSNGRVYSFGATGIVNALDARDGTVVWSRNAGSDTGAKIPGWGFASSPLVLDDAVIVAASGRLAAYDLATGEPRWFAPTGGGSYSSPHLLTIGGVAQVVLMNGTGATSVNPADGKILWKHPWPSSAMLQPAITADGALLITAGDMTGGSGTRRLAVAQGPGGWTAEEVWTSTGLKPYFNDLVVHNGHAYGFDGGILACIDITDGKRTWKGGRYGHGQLVLLPDQDVLLVLSEEGELALVAAVSDQFKELARFPALEGKTWNHPVLVGDVLLVRNGEQMAAFRLSLTRG